MDLTEYAKRQRWWNRLFGKNSGPVAEKYSVATQIAIGGLSGWYDVMLSRAARQLCVPYVDNNNNVLKELVWCHIWYIPQNYFVIYFSLPLSACSLHIYIFKLCIWNVILNVAVLM